jgi:hypothetical protein
VISASLCTHLQSDTAPTGLREQRKRERTSTAETRLDFDVLHRLRSARLCVSTIIPEQGRSPNRQLRPARRESTNRGDTPQTHLSERINPSDRESSSHLATTSVACSLQTVAAPAGAEARWARTDEGTRGVEQRGGRQWAKRVCRFDKWDEAAAQPAILRAQTRRVE